MARITFTGDMLSSPRMNRLADGDFSPVFRHAGKLRNCDLLVGNLETPVAGEELLYTHERYCFNTPTAYVDAMKAAGFGLLTLANNHCMDRGEEGILRTLENCRRVGVDTVGLYDTEEERDRIFVRELEGIRVAILNYTYGTNAFAHHRFLEHPWMVNLYQPEETLPGSVHLLDDYADIAAHVARIYREDSPEYAIARPYLERVRTDIRRAREAADYVIMVMHCGGQYVQEVDPYTLYLAERIREFGADLIVGHHQHVIQTCDKTGGFLKIYCLGNLVYDQEIAGEGYAFHDPVFSAVYHLDLSRREDGGIEAGHSFGIYTTVTDASGLPAVMDSYDIVQQRDENSLKMEILRQANLFVGGEKFDRVREVYEL